MSTAINEKGILGRYRGLMVAIAIFLVSTLVVVAITLHFAQQSRDYAARLIAAQQLREMTLELQRQTSEMNILRLRDIEVPTDFVEETEFLAGKLMAALVTLKSGGTLERSGQEPLAVTPLTQPALLDALASIEGQFKAIEDAIATLRVQRGNTSAYVAYAYSYMQRFYYRSAPEVTTLLAETQRLANDATEQLRLAQLAGLFVAFANFLYIALVSMRTLLHNDHKLGAARRETGEVLENVSDGLFLLDAHLNIGQTTSASLSRILHRQISPGVSFPDLLSEMVSDEVCQAATSYLTMLVEGRVRENLVKSLNPLSDVELTVGDDAAKTRHLSFQFARITDTQGNFSHVLVTAQDATQRMRLIHEIEQARHKSRAEVEIYLRLMGKDVATLHEFVKASRQRVETINAILRRATDRGNANYADIVRLIFQSVHALKGDAIGLGLDFFVATAQHFEDELVVLRRRNDLSGDDVLSLSVRLDEMYERQSVLEAIVERLDAAAPRAAANTTTPVTRMSAALEEIALSTAGRRHKDVRFLSDLRALAHCTENRLADIRDVAIQLVRNAVAHGIEPVDARRSANKRCYGTVSVFAAASAPGMIELRVRDDGGGIDFDTLRARLVNKGRLSAEAAATMDESRLVRYLFEPGISAIAEQDSDEDAGRGVGLDLVADCIKRLGSRARISTRRGEFTEFAFHVPVEVGAHAEAA
ncbi:ATP-binding protein [Denitromonas ohlonensis]|uniref:histidine kinase n=2 Tax=Denitromonas TaxID=139331 RepID=A0A557SDK8_9RHOO|nr:ATP-binding protein [Denitromonas ohlonensis]TVO63544.1 hypothetical protein FHP90_13770 [Denitromonas ohlonensis]TVO75421.1 hypothetical protein FHP89_13805 [Denitromonas ohlonensis]